METTTKETPSGAPMTFSAALETAGSVSDALNLSVEAEVIDSPETPEGEEPDTTPLSLGAEDEGLQSSILALAIANSAADTAVAALSDACLAVLKDIRKELQGGTSKTGLTAKIKDLVETTSGLPDRIVFPGQGPAAKRAYALPTSKAGMGYWVVTALVAGKQNVDLLDLSDVFRAAKRATNEIGRTREAGLIANDDSITAPKALVQLEALEAAKPVVEEGEEEEGTGGSSDPKPPQNLIPGVTWTMPLADILSGESSKKYRAPTSDDLAEIRVKAELLKVSCNNVIAHLDTLESLK
jgi:hypothetical protein